MPSKTPPTSPIIVLSLPGKASILAYDISTAYANPKLIPLVNSITSTQIGFVRTE